MNRVSKFLAVVSSLALALLPHDTAASVDTLKCERDKMVPVAVDKQANPRIKCWRVNSIAATNQHRRSDIWVDAASYIGNDSFCVAHRNDPPGPSTEDGVILYLENEAKKVSLIDADLTPKSHDHRDHAPGFYTTHHYFRPTAYRRWNPIKPLRLITTVQVVQSDTRFPIACPRGTIEGGNYNSGYDQDPFVALCVHYNEGVSARDVSANDYPVYYVTDVYAAPFDSKSTNATCADGTKAALSAENPLQPFKFRAHINSFFLLCLSRSRAVVANRIVKKRFVSRIFVNAGKERPLRIEYERKTEALVNIAFGCE